MSFSFKKATKSSAKLRLGLSGVSGGGKTYTALSIATGIGGRIALIDTENSSASKYADEFSFDTLNLTSFEPDVYVKAIKAAEAEGYDVIVIDSLTHAWDAAKDMASDAAERSKSKNTFTAWRDVTPQYKRIQNAIVQSTAHIIGTYRSKEEYVQDKDANGRTQVRKVGLGIEAGKGQEYEFDIVLAMEDGGKAIVSKSRYKALTGKVLQRPGQEIGKELAAWLSDGTPESNNVALGPGKEWKAQPTEAEKLQYAIFSASSKEELYDAGERIKASMSLLAPSDVTTLREAYKHKEASLG